MKSLHGRPAPARAVVLAGLVVPGFVLAGLAPAAAASDAPPPPTVAERAAAFPDLGGHEQHMDDDPLAFKVEVDQFEWQDGDEDLLDWDVEAWLGRDEARLLLRAEGSREGGDTTANELEFLYWWPVAAWWNAVAGVRNDSAAGPARTYGALGIEGLMPGQFHLEATGYFGEKGQSGLDVSTAVEVLLTNRLVLTPRIEADAWGRDDEANGIGNGLSTLTAGLRLRYELRREVAPYVGVEWEGLLGDTADLARANGAEVRDTRAVAGVRLWF